MSARVRIETAKLITAEAGENIGDAYLALAYVADGLRQSQIEYAAMFGSEVSLEYLRGAQATRDFILNVMEEIRERAS